MDVQKAAADKRTLDILEQLSLLLDTGVERGALEALLQLVRAGCEPQVHMCKLSGVPAVGFSVIQHVSCLNRAAALGLRWWHISGAISPQRAH